MKEVNACLVTLALDFLVELESKRNSKSHKGSQAIGHFFLYLCPRCSNRYKLPSSLNNHRFGVNTNCIGSQLPYFCGFCDKGYRSEHTCLMHEERHSDTGHKLITEQ